MPCDVVARNLSATTHGFLRTSSRRSSGRHGALLRTLRGVPRARTRGDDLLESLNAEVILLREENARLKMASARGPAVSSVVAPLRASAATSDACADAGDDAYRVLAEALTTRDVLLDVATELESSMAALRSRLTSLEPGTSLAHRSRDSTVAELRGSQITTPARPA